MPEAKKIPEMTSEEPNFMLFDTNRDEVPTVDEMWDEECEVSFTPAESEPDHIVQGYETLSDLLDSEEYEDFIWAEEDQETAPPILICSKCDNGVLHTRSKERAESKQYSHHIQTGH